MDVYYRDWINTFIFYFKFFLCDQVLEIRGHILQSRTCQKRHQQAGLVSNLFCSFVSRLFFFFFPPLILWPQVSVMTLILIWFHSLSCDQDWPFLTHIWSDHAIFLLESLLGLSSGADLLPCYLRAPMLCLWPTLPLSFSQTCFTPKRLNYVRLPLVTKLLNSPKQSRPVSS